MHKLSKKGGEKYLSIWWFFILILIAASIVAGVAMNSVGEANSKEIESDILATRVVDCLVSQGMIKQSLVDGSMDILNECGLNKKIIDETGKYYLRIEIFDSDKCDINNKDFNCVGRLNEFGVHAFNVQCNQPGENFPKCIEKKFYALNSSNDRFLVKIMAGSNMLGGTI